VVLEGVASARDGVVVVGGHAGAGEEHEHRALELLIVADDEAGQGVREEVRRAACRRRR
jgi:hypothetical protein